MSVELMLTQNAGSSYKTPFQMKKIVYIGPVCNAT
jgi:hypothetical protein